MEPNHTRVYPKTPPSDPSTPAPHLTETRGYSTPSGRAIGHSAGRLGDRVSDARPMLEVRMSVASRAVRAPCGVSSAAFQLLSRRRAAPEERQDACVRLNQDKNWRLKAKAIIFLTQRPMAVITNE
ncbi:MAG: hypothetical protein GY847_00680 [Proteobacteria bacterium]|nr:hypothetical protein [Pseudomonadota bacterium]